jgi:hypothetical protein
MTISIISKVQINASNVAVFKFLKDLKYHYLWNPHLRDIDQVSPITLGLEYETKSVLFGIIVNGHNTVTKFVLDQELQIENNTGTILYLVNYSVKSLSKKRSQVICTTEVTTTGIAMKFTGTILKAMVRRELQSDLQALKLAVEQDLG